MSLLLLSHWELPTASTKAEEKSVAELSRRNMSNCIGCIIRNRSSRRSKRAHP